MMTVARSYRLEHRWPLYSAEIAFDAAAVEFRTEDK